MNAPTAIRTLEFYADTLRLQLGLDSNVAREIQRLRAGDRTRLRTYLIAAQRSRVRSLEAALEAARVQLRALEALTVGP